MSQLIVKNVSKIFGEDDNLVHALSNVSFDVDKGDFLAIMGSSVFLLLMSQLLEIFLSKGLILFMQKTVS